MGKGLGKKLVIITSYSENEKKKSYEKFKRNNKDYKDYKILKDLNIQDELKEIKNLKDDCNKVLIIQKELNIDVTLVGIRFARVKGYDVEFIFEKGDLNSMLNKIEGKFGNILNSKEFNAKREEILWLKEEYELYEDSMRIINYYRNMKLEEMQKLHKKICKNYEELENRKKN